MRGLSMGKGFLAAGKADLLSLTAFEVGLFGWMALMALVFFPGPHLHPDTAASRRTAGVDRVRRRVGRFVSAVGGGVFAVMLVYRYLGRQ